MIEVVHAASWVLLALLWGRVLALLLSPPAPTETPPRTARPGVARPPGATAVVPPSAVRPVLAGPGVPASLAAVDDGQAVPAAVTPPPRAARTGVLLIGADSQALDAARAAAALHLAWLGPEQTAATRAARSDNPAVALAGARVAVLGAGGAAETEAALADCVATGVPLLLPART